MNNDILIDRAIEWQIRFGKSFKVKNFDLFMSEIFKTDNCATDSINSLSKTLKRKSSLLSMAYNVPEENIIESIDKFTNEKIIEVIIK